MSAPLVSDERVSELVMQCAVVADCDEELDAIKHAIRTAIREAGEAAAKVAADCHEAGDEEAARIIAAAIRARLG